MDQNVQVDTSCSILINGEALIFGGIDTYKRQVIIDALFACNGCKIFILDKCSF